jgi:hypothetical protein
VQTRRRWVPLPSGSGADERPPAQEIDDAVSTRSGGDGSPRQTKAEKKEQGRLERERIQRSMAARKRNRTIGIAVVVLAVIVAGVAAFALRSDEETSSGAVSPDQLLDRAEAAAKTAGCDQVQTIAPYADIADPNDPNYSDQAHIAGDQPFTELPPLSTYPSIPPTSGPHASIPPGPLPAGVYDSPPDLARVIHSLEHGAAVVWYAPAASGPDLDELKAFYDQRLSDALVGQDRVIVAPYDYPGEGGQLPEGVTMALSAWHRLQSCAQLSLPVAFDFTSQYSAPTALERDYRGDAPEAGGAL